jgi:hypothetical protein
MVVAGPFSWIAHMAVIFGGYTLGLLHGRVPYVMMISAVLGLIAFLLVIHLRRTDRLDGRGAALLILIAGEILGPAFMAAILFAVSVLEKLS